MKISICGVGNFGYAILKHLDQNTKKAQLMAYDNNKTTIEYLKKTARHPFAHSGAKVSSRVKFVNNLKELITDADIFVLAFTADYFHEAMVEIAKSKKDFKKNVIIVNVIKSLDQTSGSRLSISAKKYLPLTCSFVLLAGGTIACDLLKAEPLGAVLASRDSKALVRVYKLFASTNLKLYPTTDLIGAEYASAFKNVISIFAGIIHGLGLSYGSETYFITRFSSEIKRLATNFGAKAETFSLESQVWGNDMWMSCTGKTRNREFGILIGGGKSVKQATQMMKKMNKTVEGVNTIKALPKIVYNFKNYPLLEAVYRIVMKDGNAKKIVGELMKKSI